ncbi:leucine-rich repeat and IQ domain-containing protein 3-like isoform X2 [Lithobates pipiens]
MEENYLIPASESLLLEHGLSVDNRWGEKLEELVAVHIVKLLLKDVNLLQFCTSLKFCSLADNYIKDIRALQPCVHLVKLDLHGNQIQNLPGMEFWRPLKNMKLLYLHNNRIRSVSNVESLSTCPALLGLTLYDTPLSLQKNYRHIVVNSIWSLKALDHFVISDEEVIEDWTLQGRFKALSPELQLNMLPASSKPMRQVNSTPDTTPVKRITVDLWKIQRDVRQVLSEAETIPDLRKQNQQQPAQSVTECGHETYTSEYKTHKDQDLMQAKQVNEKQFSLSGLKTFFHQSDPSKDLLLSNGKSAKDIRSSIQQIHSIIEAKRDPASPVKCPMSKRRAMQEGQLVTLLPLHAIDKAYEKQKKYNTLIQKRNVVVQMQADKKQAKYHTEEFLEARKKQAIVQHQTDGMKLKQSAQYNLLDKANFIDNVKYRNKHFLYQKEARRLENASAREFNCQHTSVTKTLMRHDRLIRSQEEVQRKMKFVQGLKDDQEKQKQFIKCLQEHRQLVLQVENASEKFAVDSLILQKSNDRLQEAQVHVTAIKGQHVIVQSMEKVLVKQPVSKETLLKH